MDLQLAEIIAHDTREQAVQVARTDLHRLQQQAIEAGRDESRRLIKVSHIDHSTGQATYRPAGRLLRDWYLHCYTNALRDRLGSPAVTIDAQQIEDTTRLLHRLTPNQTPIAALRAVGVLRDIADADAAHATVSIATTLHATAERRAIAHAPDNRFDADLLRIHVTRHWYLHSYLEHLHTATRSQPTANLVMAPPVAVESQVALTLSTGTIHSLVSDTITALSPLDGRHAGQTATDADPAIGDDPRLEIRELQPDEAARLMFHHPAQLHAKVGHATPETSGSSSRLPGFNEPINGAGPVVHSLPPRIA